MHSFLKIIRRQKGFLIPFVFITVFICLVLAKTPIKQVFEYDPDEGTALIKTQLYLRGFPLYKKIWDDQPPLLTVILSYCFKIFGPSIYYARILILISSGILLWAFYLIIMRLNGALPALIAAVFLILSTHYLQLSVSVMPAIPSLAFAMLSIYCVIHYKKIAFSDKFLYNNKSYSWLLILSGIFMAISIQIKLITAFLIPLIFLEIILPGEINPTAQKQKNRFFYPIIFWLAGFIAVNLSTIIIFFHLNLSIFFRQLLQPHLNRLALERNNFTIILRLLFTDYDIALLTLTHIIIITQKRKKQFYLPVLWLITISFILFIHRPLWHHYYPLIAIPLCWLAAIHANDFINATIRQNLSNKKLHKEISAAGEAFYTFPYHKKGFLYWLTAGLVILIILRIPVKYHRMIESVSNGATSEEHKIINLLAAHKNNTRWLVTDRPIFAFYSGILVPPELALISNKRILAKHFTENYLAALIAKYKPEQILLTRFKVYENKLLVCIKQDYTKIYQNKLFNRIWLPLYLWWDNKKFKNRQQNWRYKMPSVQGGRSYTSAGQDIKLYLRNNIQQ